MSSGGVWMKRENDWNQLSCWLLMRCSILLN